MLHVITQLINSRGGSLIYVVYLLFQFTTLSPQHGKSAVSTSVSKIETHQLTEEMSPICNFVRRRNKLDKFCIYTHVFTLCILKGGQFYEMKTATEILSI